jgi:aspartyl-tRNA(Asn)/glutamyl-tRNA(Gln) amidotransferase subunit B
VAEWEPVIGLEIHTHLKTRTKMFCRCETGFGADPNTHTCPVCLAHPGALPVPNERAIEWTVKLGLALGCRIADRAVFHRKNYFYPDLPKGYQISQFDEPLCVDGRLLVPHAQGDREVGIIRAHLEEDAAKTIHVGGATGRIVGAAHSNVDFNRGGTPLVEIVTQPDIRSADEAKEFLQLLRQTIVELGISDAEMEKGTLRADANVSVREAGETGYRTRTELKNMNSFNHIARGIDAEIRRQVGVWESGGEVVQQTLDYEVRSDTVTARRQKEEADDYRYFPEPDLVPIEPPRELVERLRAELPELPGERIRSLADELGFDAALELVTTGNDWKARRLNDSGMDMQRAATVVMNKLSNVVALDENWGALVEIDKNRDRLPRAVSDAAFAQSGTTLIDVEEVLAQASIADPSELEPIVDRILMDRSNVAVKESYRAGKHGTLGFFVGQVMKETKGKADPKLVSELLRRKLDAPA